MNKSIINFTLMSVYNEISLWQYFSALVSGHKKLKVIFNLFIFIKDGVLATINNFLYLTIIFSPHRDNID